MGMDACTTTLNLSHLFLSTEVDRNSGYWLPLYYQSAYRLPQPLGLQRSLREWKRTPFKLSSFVFVNSHLLPLSMSLIFFYGTCTNQTNVSRACTPSSETAGEPLRFPKESKTQSLVERHVFNCHSWQQMLSSQHPVKTRCGRLTTQRLWIVKA